MKVSRKSVAFGMRCLAEANLTNHLWSSISCIQKDIITISSTSADPTSMSPLDTAKFNVTKTKHQEHPTSQLHHTIHQLSNKPVVVHISNHNMSWFSSHKTFIGADRVPAYDTNCQMFAESGSIVTLDAPYDDFQNIQNVDLSQAKAVILPNRSVAIVANTIETAVMRSIYFDFSVSTLMKIETTGNSNHTVASEEEVKRRNTIWVRIFFLPSLSLSLSLWHPFFNQTRIHMLQQQNHDDTFRNCPEIDLLARRMTLPDWWSKVDVSEFNDDNVDELTLLAACDLAPNTVIARVGGRVVPESNKYTIRLSNSRHLLMSDVPNSVQLGQVPSVFSYINHSFNPNVRCIPDGDSVVFETLRRIDSGESLSFDYTTTEEPAFAAPFVDIETGRNVGM